MSLSSVFEILINKINLKVGKDYTFEDFEMSNVPDELIFEKNKTGNYSGEKRCVYDIYTIQAEGGHRVRVFMFPDSHTSISPILHDNYSGDVDFNLNPRANYTCTMRVNSKLTKMPVNSSHCPDLSDVFIEDCISLVTESGDYIISEDNSFVLTEQSKCT